MKTIINLMFLTISIIIYSIKPCYSDVHHHVSTGRQLFKALTEAANNGKDDCINISPGIYKGGFTYTSSEPNGLTISGSSPDQVILDGGGVEGVLYIDAVQTNEFADINIYGLTLRNGRVNGSGGGIFIKNGGSTCIYNCKIYNNIISSGSGHGLYLSNFGNKNINLGSNIFYNNGNNNSTSIVYIHNNLSDIIFTSNIIKNNSSFYKGGIYIISEGKVNINSNTISNNSASRESAGIFANLQHSGSISLYKNKITDNIVRYNSTETSNGAGAYIVRAKSVSFSSNIITGNSVKDRKGGGIYIDSSENISLMNNILAKNSAVYGGAMYIFPVNELNIINNTIAENSADEDGGGMYLNTSSFVGTMNIYNNIIWENTSNGNGDDIYIHGYGGTRNLYNNNYQEINGEWDYSENNLSVSPLFFSPERGDYHIQASSQCINAGYQYYTMYDEYGKITSNIRDKDNIKRNIIDIGAYEYNTDAKHPADTNSNWIIEESEFTSYNNSWRNRGYSYSSYYDGNLIPIDYVTRAGYIVESGGSYINTGAGKPVCWTPNNSN